MDCVILGAGGMMPMPLRLTTSMLIRLNGRMMMFDAGEGIQLALKKGGLGIRNLDCVAISHLHADHVLGLPGIMMFRAQCDDPAPLTIVGPPGIERFIRHTLSDLAYRINFQLQFVEWSKDASSVAWQWQGGTLTWAPLTHSTLCLGYRFEEPARPGKFDPDRADALGVPRGPARSQLQSGTTITNPAGVAISPADVLGPSRRGRIVTFATDTRPCKELSRLCRGADLAVMEGMFARVHQEEAIQKKHSTAAETAELARQAGVTRLILVHISPRYSLAEEAILQEEASVHFPGALVGRGLDSFSVPLPD